MPTQPTQSPVPHRAMTVDKAAMLAEQKDGGDFTARGILESAGYLKLAMSPGITAANLTALVSLLNTANPFTDITWSQSGGKLVATTTATGTSETITVKGTGTANAALGFAGTDQSASGTSVPGPAVLTAPSAPLAAAFLAGGLFGLTLTITDTGVSAGAPVTYTFTATGLIVTGTMTDGVGNVLPLSTNDVVLESIVNGSGSGNITPSTGTVKTGSGSTKCWLELVSGKFVATVAGAAGDLILFETRSNLCANSSLALQF